MPLYEYACRDCDHQPELLVRPSDPTPACPECGSERLVKLLSVPAAPASQAGGDPSEGPCGSACGCFPPN
ncbi:MAG: zinc ribbon domain-containing protein [Planctomycetota bacterium]